MNAEGGAGGAGRGLTRREFVGLGAAGAAAFVLAGCAGVMAQEEQGTGFSYKGRRIRVAKREGRPELFIDGERIVTVHSNGAFRAANFMFSPQPTRVGLAKRIVDYRAGLAGG